MEAQNGGGGGGAPVVLNVYDLTPINNYLYWFGLGIFHSGIEGFDPPPSLSLSSYLLEPDLVCFDELV
jgi:hypothetical protein